jgi:hypothetical protein
MARGASGPGFRVAAKPDLPKQGQVKDVARYCNVQLDGDYEHASRSTAGRVIYRRRMLPNEWEQGSQQDN